MADSVPWLQVIVAVAAALLTGALLSALWYARQLRQQREEVIRLQTRLEEEQRQAEIKLDILARTREELREQFRLLAHDVIDEKSRRLTENNRLGLAEILRPLQEKISAFEKKVDDSYNQEARERFALAREIRKLQELNVRISEDAVSLTRALRGDNKTQGAWGEFILSSILEASGLTEGREYETQRSFHDNDSTDEGTARLRSQPDVVVHLPENRQLIIDAKVSLTAYERFCVSEDDAERAEALRQHAQSLRGHIRQLSEKRYQNLPNIHSLDFVLLFMPVEPAFSLALQHEPELFNHAFERNIVLVGPSTLLVTLRTIHNIWRYEYQSRNAQEIARQAGAMYDKFVGFVADMDELGRKLDAGQRSFDLVMNKLHTGKGNLITRAEKLKALGARTSKQQEAGRLSRAQETEDEDDEN
jgi:DNA recombination protein RmuC